MKTIFNVLFLIIPLWASTDVTDSHPHWVLLLMFLSIIVAIVAVVLYRKNRNRGDTYLTHTRIAIMDKEVQIISKYIEENFSNPDLSPEFICNELSTGLSFVETLFNKELGMSLYEFIENVRVHHAVNFINSGFEGSKEELMKSCGFSDLHYFEQQFKKVTNVDLETVIENSTQ